MVPFAMIAVLFSFDLVAQQAPGAARDAAGDWVVFESKEGQFSFAMPGKPFESSTEMPTPAGKIQVKAYSLQRGEEFLALRHHKMPHGLQQNAVSRAFVAGLEKAGPEKIQILSKTSFTVQGVSGLQVITRGDGPGGKGKLISWTHVFERGPDIYILAAGVPEDRPFPPEATAFMNSIRFDGKPADKPTIPVASANAAMAKPAAPLASAKAAPARPAVPAKRKMIGKIDRVDTTADATLRTFAMAMAAGDEETLRDVTMPNADFDWLLRGEGAPVRGLRELKQQVIKARVDRLKEGDRVKVAGKEVHVIRAAEVGRDHAALKIDGLPAYAPLEKVRGHWKVDPAPIIAARKAAEGAK